MILRTIHLVFVLLLSLATGRRSLAGEPPPGEHRVPDLFQIWVEKKIGFIDRNGRIIVEPQFDWAYAFSEGLCQVANGKRQGYIDPNGKWVFEMETHDERPFRNSVAVVCTGKRTGIVDRAGHLIDCPFDWINNFSEGLAAVCVIPEEVKKQVPRLGGGPLHRRWGFIDTTGKVVVPTKFSAASDFHEGLAAVYVGGRDTGDTGLVGGKWGYIDPAGEFVIEPQFRSARDFSEGLAAVSFDDRNYGWIDKDGGFAVKKRPLLIASSFHDGVAKIRGESGSIPGFNDFGYITKAGEVFLHPNFRFSVSPFSEGLTEAHGPPTWNAELGKWGERKMGFLDKQGNWVIEPQFTHAKPFRNGLAYVQKDGKTAYIDKTGRVVWPADGSIPK